MHLQHMELLVFACLYICVPMCLLYSCRNAVFARHIIYWQHRNIIWLLFLAALIQIQSAPDVAQIVIPLRIF